MQPEDILRKLADYAIDPTLLTFEDSSLYYTSQGACADVRKATLAKPSGSVTVAVKVLRIADNVSLEDLQRVSDLWT